MSNFEQIFDQNDLSENKPSFGLPQNFDNLDFNGKQRIIAGLAGQIYRHLYLASLDPRMDTEDLKKVIGDLLANAADATKSMVRDVRVRASREHKSKEPTVIIEVLDNGPGFPAEKLGQDLQAPVGTTKTVHGNLGGQGSGLHLCNLLVTKAGGKLSYGNREEGGAFVKLELPAYKQFNGLSTISTFVIK